MYNIITIDIYRTYIKYLSYIKLQYYIPLKITSNKILKLCFEFNIKDPTYIYMIL